MLTNQKETHKILFDFKIRGVFNEFPDIFEQAFKIVVDS